MRLITRQEYRCDLGFETDTEGLPEHRSIASAICRAVERWGIAPRVRVIAHTKEQLRVAGLGDDAGLLRVQEVLKRLELLGVVEAVYLAGQPHCARAKARWVRLTDDVGVLTGTVRDPGIPPPGANAVEKSADGLVIRFGASDLEALATLHAKGITEWSLEDWRGQPGHLEHLFRRAPTSSTLTLAELWKVLTDAMTDNGLLLSGEAQVRAVAGRPGGYFGKGDGPIPTGRWTDSPADGVWCGVRKGYSDNHWRPILLAVDGEQRRVLDLYDFSEWRWALVARGLAFGDPEHASRDGDLVSFSYPLPNDLFRLMLLIGDQQSGWRWKVPARMPDLWTPER